MDEKEEDLKKKRKDELYSRMTEIRMGCAATIGSDFKYIRGQGLVRR